MRLHDKYVFYEILLFDIQCCTIAASMVRLNYIGNHSL